MNSPAKILPITLVVITKNEASNIARCLDAADFCAEKIVVDSGSTDNTVQIAGQHGARVLLRQWTGYGDQKNFGAAHASNEWVLCIDADEVVSAELRDSILRNFESDPQYDAFEITRHSYYGGKLINHCGWYPEWRFFLYRKSLASWGGNEPHTVVILSSKRTARLSGDLFHYTYADIHQHIAKIVAAAHASAVDMHSRGKTSKLTDLILRGPWATFRAYFIRLGILDGFYGLVISVLIGFYTFLKYAMLRELCSHSHTTADK